MPDDDAFTIAQGIPFVGAVVHISVMPLIRADMLLSAVETCYKNAFNFAQHHTAVSLSAYAAADRVRIDVEDNCGGLPSGDTE